MKKEFIELADAFMAQDVDQRAERQKDERKQAEILVELAADVQLFHTPEVDLYAQLLVDGHFEIWPLRGKSFRSWLTGQFYRASGKPAGNQPLRDAIGVLEARAQFDSPERVLFVRIGERENRIYVDLGDEQRRAVEISTDGWSVISDPPVRFRRTKGMRALPEPVTGGTITMLRRFLNLGGDTNWTLCLAWLIAAYRPKGPYPMLLLQGEQGSAKSTTAKLLRRLIDPSISPVRTPPRDDRDLLIGAHNSWVIAYDNLSGIPPWLSDALCRLATGGGLSTRELYTDADEVFFDAMRPVILNGIDHLAERADLADRSLILNLPPIEEQNRKDEAQLYAEFGRDLPKILGAVFTVVSQTLARLPQTRLDRKPRMADFALWATAADQALGLGPGGFMDAYAGNRTDAVQETLDADPVGNAVLAMMDDHTEATQQWVGSCKDLLQHLEQRVDDGTKRSREWPKNPRALSGRLRRLATFLRAAGIQITFHPRTGKGQRLLTLSRNGVQSIVATATSATRESNYESDQALEAAREGGAVDSGVVDGQSLGDQPPPDLPSGNRLTGLKNTAATPEVTEVAVVCSTLLSGTGDPTYCCSNCGPVEWVWNGTAWVCPHCSAPASGQQVRSAKIERFKL